ncbi:MAG: hypothetical protein KJ574_01140, partial [Nanoarchaeota archaeon]|nr:hypothetical protein [Nanoarchaeota archaeon]
QLCHEFDVPILHEARFMKEKEEARAKLARYLLANGYRRVPLPECIINSTLEIWYKQFVPPGVCLRYHGRKSVFADRNLA